MTIEEALLRADEGLLGPISCKILAAEVRRLREELKNAGSLWQSANDCMRSERDRYREALTEISKPWRHKYAVEYVLQGCQEIARDALRGEEE